MSRESVQSKAARIITGAFRATSPPALDVEGYLLPLHLQLEKSAGEPILRLATSSSFKTLVQFKPRKKTHKASPLEVLAAKFSKQWGIKLESIESILPFVAPPWWCSPKICIQTNKKQAKNSLDQRMSQLLPGEYVYYTDGSAINNKVGAAIVASTQAFTLQLFLRAASFYTVYSAELVGILGALHLALARPLSGNCQRVIIFTDNQAAIRAPRAPVWSDQYYEYCSNH